MATAYATVFRKLAKLPLVPFALLAVAVMRFLADRGMLIRLCAFTPRLGHQALDTELYLCERDAGMHPESIDIWTHRSPPPNVYLAKMWGRIMRVWPAWIVMLVGTVNALFKGWEQHSSYSQQHDRDIFNLLEKSRPHLQFTPAEMERGEATLKAWGLPAGAQWVCLMVRDSAYLPKLGYHSYRDCDVDDYMEAALMLANRGYYVFRMGIKVAKPFAAKHPRIFDLAEQGMNSDFMSVYLGAFCAFTVSTSTGWDGIPQIFRRPMCYTNFAPLEYLPTWMVNALAIWQHHYKDGKRMTPAEIYESGAGQFMAADRFTEAGIELRRNTPAEITEVVREMADMIDGRFRPKAQEAFWAAFPLDRISPYNERPLHGAVRLRIGSKFLEDYDAGREENIGDHTGARRLQAGAV